MIETSRRDVSSERLSDEAMSPENDSKEETREPNHKNLDHLRPHNRDPGRIGAGGRWITEGMRELRPLTSV